MTSNPSLPVIIIGAGGHAKPVIDALMKNGTEIIGAVDVNPAKHGVPILGVPVLGKDGIIGGHAPGSLLLVNGVGTTSETEERREVFCRFKERGYNFKTVIHPSALIGVEVEIGEGSQILAGAVIQPATTIGANCIINTNATVDHDCAIGDHVHVAPGAAVSGVVEIGDGCHVGSGATIIQGLTIGPRSIIGSGAAVIRDVAQGDVVCGVPARTIKRGEIGE